MREQKEKQLTPRQRQHKFRQNLKDILIIVATAIIIYGYMLLFTILFY